jgi:hypothetical protein
MNYNEVSKELYRHRKIAYVNVDDLLDFFGNWHRKDKIILREFAECEGAAVIDVYFERTPRLLAVVLAREDWPEVVSGACPESINGFFSRQKVVSILPDNEEKA